MRGVTLILPPVLYYGKLFGVFWRLGDFVAIIKFLPSKQDVTNQ